MENYKLLPIKLEPVPIVKDNIENNIDIWLQNEVGMLYQNESQLLKTEDKINKLKTTNYKCKYRLGK